jgi:ABC-type polysaccharide/polyol phosphate export permease
MEAGMTTHLTSLWRYRHFWMSLVRLDLRNRYRRSVLGVGWSLLNPIAMTAVFCVAFGQILNQGDWRTLAPLLLAGMAVWNLLRDAVLQGCDSFIRAEAYIRQCPLPFAIYPLRTTLGLFIHFMISLVVVVLAIMILKPEIEVLAVLPSLVPGVVLVTIFAWSLATIASFANVFFHDTKHLTEVLAQLLFFLTPVMFTRDMLDKQGVGIICDLNPAAYFIELFRASLLSGEAPALALYAQCTAITVAGFALACGTMAWLSRRIVFHL